MLRKFRQDYPKHKNFFDFPEFNEIQKKCFPKIFVSSENIIVSAPTGSGKTVLFQLLILKMMSQMKTKCLYLAPIKSLCQEKTTQWKQKFLSKMQVMELTGDTLQMQNDQFQGADIYVATPQKIDYISRKNLNFIKQLKLLLIDEIHMLNMQDRGAILQAIVTRILSMNKSIRVMAVSATIPNIKQVAQWLKVPKDLICVFGQQYRPVKLQKVVLGFKSANNDFNFQKILNFKVLQIIRQYSCGGGTLIFCQTQKGTEQACHKIISQIKQRQFLDNQTIYKNIMEASKLVDNVVLKGLLPQGVAFHNASLSMKDRAIVQKLFLDLNVKVLCTTSTLAMGINLPARLVIIKSTKCYKGSGKGYQQYNQIEIDQMMGRAGRIPFDIQGTVVIMTEKQNYNKYLGENKLQNLQSQLFSQLSDHLNTQISLKSVQSLKQAQQYFHNSFCYIRMLKDSNRFLAQFGSKYKTIDEYVKSIIHEIVNKLSDYGIIQYISDSGKIFPKQISMNISRNAIQVQSIIRIIQGVDEIVNQRGFIELLSKANQFNKFRSKLDERKCLKDLNEKLKYSLKETISTSDKKTFVLIQSQLSGTHIQSWEMRKQAKQIINFTKRLSYCIKSLAIQKKGSHKTFWPYLYGCLFHKYCTLGYWEQNSTLVLKQINRVEYNWKNITARGIRNLQELVQGLDKLDIFGNNVSSTSLKNGIEQQMAQLRDCIQISLKKAQAKAYSQPNDLFQPIKNSLQCNQMLRLIFTRNFTQKFKLINVMIQQGNSIYHSGFISRDNPQFNVFLKNTQKQKYFIAIIKQGYVGFDQFYIVENGQLRKALLKRESQKNKKKINMLELQKFDVNEMKLSQNKKRGRKIKSVDVNSIQKTHKFNKKIVSNESKKIFPKKILFNDNISKQKQLLSDYQIQQQQKQPNSNTLKIKRNKQLTLTEDFNTIKRKYIHDEQNYRSNPLSKQMKRPDKIVKYGDLKSYNWKPGFQAIKDNGFNQKKWNGNKQGSIELFKKKLLLDENNQEKDKNCTEGQESDGNETQKYKFKQKNVIADLNNFMKIKIKQRKHHQKVNNGKYLNQKIDKIQEKYHRQQPKNQYPISNKAQQTCLQVIEKSRHNLNLIKNQKNYSSLNYKEYQTAPHFNGKSLKNSQSRPDIMIKNPLIFERKNNKIVDNINSCQNKNNINKQRKSAYDYFDALFEEEEYQI